MPANADTSPLSPECKKTRELSKNAGGLLRPEVEDAMIAFVDQGLSQFKEQPEVLFQSVSDLVCSTVDLQSKYAVAKRTMLREALQLDQKAGDILSGFEKRLDQAHEVLRKVRTFYQNSGHLRLSCESAACEHRKENIFPTMAKGDASGYFQAHF